MKIVLKTEDLKDIILVREIPELYATGEPIKEYEATGEYKGVKGNTKTILMDGFMISISKMFQPEELVVFVEHDEPHLEMHFEFTGGQLFTNKSAGGRDIQYKEGQHALYYFPELKGYVKTPPKEEKFCVEVALTIDFLKKALNDDLSILKEFGKCIEENRPTILGNQCFPITFHMRQVLMDIINCQYAGILKKVYCEAKVLELLSLQIAQLNSIEDKSGYKSLHKEDIEKLYYVKELVSVNYTTPYSLIQLSKIAGINNFKLKEGFKELFDNTIFGYLYEVRMEKAKSLLMHSDLSISEISYQVGYKNPQHFTAAFKKKFGVLPRDIKGNS